MTALALFTILMGVIISCISTKFQPGVFIDHIWPIYVGTIIATIGPIISDAKDDARRIINGKKLNYTVEVLKRWWFLPIAFINGWTAGIAGMLVMLQASWYWIFFDQWLKKELDQEYFFVGSTAMLDKIFKKDFAKQAMAKLLLFGIFSYFVLSEITFLKIYHYLSHLFLSQI